MKGIVFEGSEITVGTDFTTVYTMTMQGYDAQTAAHLFQREGMLSGELHLELDSSASSGATLSDGRLQIQAHRSGTWWTYVSAFTANPNVGYYIMGVIGKATQTPKDIAAGVSGQVIIRIPACYAWRVQSKVAANTALITARGVLYEMH